MNLLTLRQVLRDSLDAVEVLRDTASTSYQKAVAERIQVARVVLAVKMIDEEIEKLNTRTQDND